MGGEERKWMGQWKKGREFFEFFMEFMISGRNTARRVGRDRIDRMTERSTSPAPSLLVSVLASLLLIRLGRLSDDGSFPPSVPLLITRKCEVDNLFDFHVHSFCSVRFVLFVPSLPLRTMCIFYLYVQNK